MRSLRGTARPKRGRRRIREEIEGPRSTSGGIAPNPTRRSTPLYFGGLATAVLNVARLR